MLRPDHIRKIVFDRGIEHLLHFTFEKNLPSIFSHGLLPRDELEQREDIMAFGSDPYRDDGHTDATCLSVTRFQGPMLRRVLRDHPKDDFVILGVHPSVLWENLCLFCDANASSNWIKRSSRNLSTAYAFERMFEDATVPKSENGNWVNVSTRQRDGLPDSVPTDAQAEILVKGHIPPDRILGIWVETITQRDRINAIFQTNSECRQPDVFVAEYSFNVCEGE